MAKDFFHNTVRVALEKEEWRITHDPYEIKTDVLELFDSRMQVDLGAEKLIAAYKDKEKIAVEVKSLLGPSLIYDLHNLVGQFMNYQIGLDAQEPDRVLFVAIPELSYDKLENQEFFRRIIAKVNLRIIVFNPDHQNITKWVK
ncbi:MAG: fatty-acid oxidation protein subunit alpha [Saprospiraceae bacterium]|nr:fatty-acid oxidation protein subunit alpha [Saprospiraceae bacterium]